MTLGEHEVAIGELHYENRIVSFFDTLGWKSQIEAAGNNPRQIAHLAMLPRMFSQCVTALAQRLPGAHITSFSDNVIVSLPFQADRVFASLEGLARIQAGVAIAGFFVRGAVTIGKLFHDDQIVFGPALNRAHELESSKAKYPRVILDPKSDDLLFHTADFLSEDVDYRFIDPFNFQFFKRALATNPATPEVIAQFYGRVGLPPQNMPSVIDASQLLHAVFLKVNHELEAATCSDVRKKYEWLFDRISLQINGN